MAIHMAPRSRAALALFILSILTIGFCQNVRAQSGLNVALASNGGVAVASSTVNPNFPANAVNNGDRKGLNWGAGGGWNDATPNAYPDWIEIDFSSAQSINEIDVFTLQDNWSAPSTPTLTMLFTQYGVSDFQVQYWTGSTWVDVPNGNVAGNRNVWRQFTFANIATSKIRVLVNNSLSPDGVAYSRIAEIEAYASPSLPPGSNAALAANGGVATASSAYSADYPVTSVNNGDRKGLNWANGGGWNDGTINVYPDWVQIDFSSSQTINEIDVFTVQDNFGSPVTPTLAMQFSQWGVTDFQVQYWNGSNWTDVSNGNVTGNRNVWRQFTFPSVITNKIRVLVNGGMGGSSRIVEIEAYTPLPLPPGANAALADNGGVATASSSYNANYPVSAVNDGDRKGVNWAAGGGWNDATVNTYPDWVQVEFSTSQTINEIDVFTIQDNFANPIGPTLTTQFSQYGVTDFEVQYWTGSTWADVPNGNVTGNRNVWRQFTFANITTSKIRVLVNNALGGYSRIVEIEAYTPSLPPSPLNVALAVNGGVPTASSTSNGNCPVTAVNNGDRKGLNWGAGGGWNDGTGNSFPDWVQIDFTTTQTINEIDVFTIQDNWSNPSTPTLSMQFSQYGVTDFEVQYWTGSTWADVPNGNVTGNRNVWRQFTFANITTSKIRVLVNNGLTGYSRITEVEAYQAPGTAAPSPTPSPTPSSGVWIAPRTDGQDGTGTNRDPYNGSTAAKLITVINNYIPGNTVVHFAPGNYAVSNITPKPGMKFLGAGKDVTNFFWNGEPQSAMISSYGGAHGAEISDLTLNGQQDVWGPTPMALITFDCNDVKIRNVHVTNFKGGQSEAFLLSIFCETVSVTGAVIENCEIDHFIVGSGGGTLLGLGHGGGGDPTARVSGIVQNNYIHDCPGLGIQGIGGGGTNSVYQGNVVVGADKGWYHDCFPASGSQAVNNHFLNCTTFGMVATSVASGTDDPNNGCDGLIVANNTITMDPTVFWGVSGVLIQGSYVTNTQVWGNTVEKNNATSIQYGFNIKSPGSIVHDNFASPGFTNIP
jgi:hypothetical protein